MSVYDLAIEAVSISGVTKAVYTERYLHSLSDTEWSDLRAQATRSRRAGDPILRCGDCGGPVYARESSTGRRHCYHFGTELKNCRWASANARDFRSIDADKFGGNQEGERHRLLKTMIIEILKFDAKAAEAGITAERYTKGADGHYGFPDVFATSWQGGPAAFEIQPATTQLPTIIRREDFYATNSIRLCWIVGADEARLNRRAFKDIYLRNDGQILGIDGEVLEAARRLEEPQFRLFRLLPGSAANKFAPIWRNRIVGISGIDWGAPNDRPRSAHSGYDAYLDHLIEREEVLRRAREEFYTALTEYDEETAKQIWDTMADKVGGLRWSELGLPHEVVRAFGVLATLRRQQITVKTKIGFANLPHLVNSILLEPKERRCWTHAFKLMAKAVAPQLLTISSVAQKCERNLAALIEKTPSDLSAGQVFNTFFPEGAFHRLQLSANPALT